MNVILGTKFICFFYHFIALILIISVHGFIGKQGVKRNAFLIQIYRVFANGIHMKNTVYTREETKHLYSVFANKCEKL